MRAIIIRHYKTLINESGLIMGWGDAPRAKEWRADLIFVDTIINQFGIQISSIYTSYLERARQTGMFFAKQRGMPLVHDVMALNEINYGLLYRKEKAWVEKNIPQHKKDPDFVYPEGESFRQMQARSVAFIESLARKCQDETILIVVHAGIIRGLISHFLGLPYAENLKRKITHRYIGDFLFEWDRCVRYDELGKPSGFIKDRVISVPLDKSVQPATGKLI